MKTNTKYKPQNKTIGMQQALIVVLSVLLVFSASIAFTLALLGEVAYDRAFISFAPPVRVVVSDGEQPGRDSVTEVFDNMQVLPGDRKPVKLGFTLSGANGEVSSPAYVRVKFNSYIEMGDEGEDLSDLINVSLAVFNDPLNSLGWVLTNFGTEEAPDIWWLYTNNPSDENTITSKKVESGEIGKFLDGEIEVDREVDARHQEKQILIEYTVEASQWDNIKDPISSRETYENELGQTIYKGIWQDPLHDPIG